MESSCAVRLLGFKIRWPVLARPVQVEHRRRQHQHESRAPLRGGQRAEHPDPRPASLPCAQEDADRQRQIQRLGVVRREVERHRRERRDEHGQPGHLARIDLRETDPGATAAPELECGQTMDAIQRARQCGDRQQHAGCHRRHAQMRDRAQAERVQREEGRSRRGERAQVRAVTVMGDHQIPRRIPARRGSRQQIAQPAKSPCHAGRVERVAHRTRAKRQHRAAPGEPDKQTRAPQRPPHHARRHDLCGIDRRALDCGPPTRELSRSGHAGYLGCLGVHIPGLLQALRQSGTTGRKSQSER